MMRLHTLLLSTLATASVGMLWTGALSWIRISDNEYLAQGLRYNALRLLLDGLADGAMGGALIGAFLFVLAASLGFLKRVTPTGRAPEMIPYVFYLSFTLIVIGAQALAHDEIDLRRMGAVYALALVWCGVFFSKHLRLVRKHPLLAAFLTTILYLLPALTLVIALITSDNVGLLWRAETIIASSTR